MIISSFFLAGDLEFPCCLDTGRRKWDGSATASLAVGSGLIQIEMNNKENDASK
jgi:hypothetical protein